jgi:hypothetical protein
LDSLNAEIGVYNQLREAFGKKGLQAMIIESAIPEVETEANRLHDILASYITLVGDSGCPALPGD